MRRIFFFLLLGLIFGGGKVMALTLSSPVFQDGLEIPSLYTCDGQDISPGLLWQDVPEGTVSFALICDDPDVPETLKDQVPTLVWDHWVLFDIPANVRAIPQGGFKGVEKGSHGKNSWGRNDYGGPCPPNPKPHRYFFKLFALDTMLNLSPSTTKDQLLKAMEGHILDQATLMGTYLRGQFRK